MVGRCWGVVDKLCDVVNAGGVNGELAGICWGGKGGRRVKLNIKIEQFICCSKSLGKCDRVHGGSSIGREAVGIQYTTGQAMVVAGD